MKKTIRLKIPQWQGGNKAAYVFGPELLAFLAPENAAQPVIEVPVPKPEAPLQKENGVVGQSVVAKNVDLAAEAIAKEAPDKIITLGGDCLVSQAPFDYLHGKYGDEVGIIWIDAHPDISTPEIYFHEHAMVLGNLLGHGDPVLAEKVRYPYEVKDVLFVGLQEPTSDEKVILKELSFPYEVQSEARLSPAAIQGWLQDNDFTKTVVHLDLDAIDPKEFYSLYFTEPGIPAFSAEAGKMSLAEVQETLAAISEVSEMVGLTVAEFLPWDALNLQKLFAGTEIFN